MDSNHVKNSPSGELISQPGWTLRQYAMALVWGGVGMYALIFVYHGAAVVAYPYDLDNSEGFLLYQSVRIADGEFLYPPLEDAPYMVDNYPPIYPLLGSFAVAYFGTNLHGLRAISLISTLLTALLLGAWTHQRTQSRSAAIMAGLIFLSFYHVYQWGALARVDALGLLFCITALVVFERWRNWGFALLFLLLAMFTKQSLFAAPLAILLSLLATDWRRALKFLIVLLFSAFVFWEFILLVTDNLAWHHLITYNVNTFYWMDVWVNFRHWVWMYTVWGCAPLAVLLFDANRVRSNQDSASPMLFWFTLGAIGEAMLCGKIGSAPNYFLALAAAAAVGSGVIFYQVQQYSREQASNQAAQIVAAFFTAAFILQLAATIHWPSPRFDFAQTPTRSDTQAGRLMENRVRQIEGPVLSDLCGLPLLAGKTPLFQPFINTQLAKEGKWDQRPFLSSIKNRMYPALLLRFDLSRPDWDRRRFTEEMIAAFRETYAPSQQMGAYYLYTLKS